MSDYTGRVFAIFSDVHGFYEPFCAVLSDIKKRGITEVYSLGDNIGWGPDSSLILDSVIENNIKCINGNHEDYVVLGEEPFSSYFNLMKRISNDWTISLLRSDQIDFLKNNLHSYDLLVGGKNIGLCHFANDVRIDFKERSCWSYQFSIETEDENPQEQFYYTNSSEQLSQIEKFSKFSSPMYNGYKSAYTDRLFDGKTVDFYDEIIQGHVHFKLFTSDSNVIVRTIRACSMGFGVNDYGFASYIIVKEKKIGYDVEEVLVAFDMDKMVKRLSTIDFPEKKKVLKMF